MSDERESERERGCEREGTCFARTHHPLLRPSDTLPDNHHETLTYLAFSFWSSTNASRTASEGPAAGASTWVSATLPEVTAA